MATGETCLNTLLANLSPVLAEKRYVFVTLPETLSPAVYEQALCIFRETEGTTFILDADLADKHGYAYDGYYRQIICKVHSSLDAVGMTAAISTLLAENGISANVVAAYYHDHIFVQEHKAEQAVALMQELAESS